MSVAAKRADALLAGEPMSDEVAAESAKAGQRAKQLSWGAWAPIYRELLEEVAGGAR